MYYQSFSHPMLYLYKYFWRGKNPLLPIFAACILYKVCILLHAWKIQMMYCVCQTVQPILLFVMFYLPSGCSELAFFLLWKTKEMLHANCLTYYFFEKILDSTKRPWFVRGAVVNRRDVLNKLSARLDGLINSLIDVKVSWLLWANTWRRDRLDSKPFTCHESDTHKLHTRCCKNSTRCLHVCCAKYACFCILDDILCLSKCATKTAICHVLFALGLF